jgi:acyl-CoA reductase-like NAD-dependent aldehyde dehydrogenase
MTGVLGQDTDVAGSPTTRELVVRCPANHRIVGRVAEHTPDDVADLARALRKDQPAWEALGPMGRGRWLSQWRDWLLDNSQHLLGLVQQESGKSWGDCSIEIQACTEVINYYVRNAATFLQTRRPRAHSVVASLKRLEVDFRPYPLVGVISPWNFPLGMPMLDIPAALMAGCAVLSKPSEVTPLAWCEAVRGWRDEVGGPNVVACAIGLGDIGTAVIDQVDMIQFTGSVETGRRVATRAAQRLIPCSLELGGKDPMIVLADADLERAVHGAIWGGFFNAGQCCVAVERVYVEAPVYDQFVRSLTEQVARLRQGMDRPRSYETDFGATATQSQIETIEHHVNDAVNKGARALTGGHRAGTGLFFEPTILVDVDHSMACMQEETFGPVLPVMAVANAEEAIRRANESRYGLSASVWTRNQARARQIARRLEVGAVNVNDVMMNVFQFSVPHGGWRESGVGYRFGGSDGMLKYCRPQAITAGRFEPKAEVHWYPHSRKKGRLLAAAAHALGARDWKRRLRLRGDSDR